VPLFPLPNVVLFPGARLPLHIFEPRYRRLVADLLEAPEAERRIGMILETDDGLCEPGCAGRLVLHEPLPEGRSNIVLEGEFRFRLDAEREPRPYRVGEVSPLEDAVRLLDEERAEALHGDLVALAARLVRCGRERSGIDLGELAGAGDQLVPLVGRIATHLDVPPLRRQSLLALDPLERAAELAGILRSRIRLFEALAPFRAAAGEPALN